VILCQTELVEVNKIVSKSLSKYKFSCFDSSTELSRSTPKPNI